MFLNRFHFLNTINDSCLKKKVYELIDVTLKADFLESTADIKRDCNMCLNIGFSLVGEGKRFNVNALQFGNFNKDNLKVEVNVANNNNNNGVTNINNIFKQPSQTTKFVATNNNFPLYKTQNVKPLNLEKSNSQKDFQIKNRENIQKQNNNFAGRYKSPSPMFKKAHSKLKEKTPVLTKKKFDPNSANSYQTPNKSEKKIMWHP
jgi:hypothetical protein